MLKEINAGSLSRSGRSPGGGHGNLRQYPCMENPWTEEPGGLQSTGLQKVEHNGSNFTHPKK